MKDYIIQRLCLGTGRTHSSFLRTLLALMLLTGTSNAWAANYNISFTIKCKYKEAITFSLTHGVSATIGGQDETITVTPSWNNNADENGYYTGTITSNQYQSDGFFGVGKYNGPVKLTVSPKSSYHFVINNSVTDNSQTLCNKTNVKSNVSESYTINYVYPEESHTETETITLNFSGSNTTLATIAWNEDNVTEASVSKSGSYQYKTVNGIFYNGAQSADFANSITITPANENVVVNWELRNGNSVVSSGIASGTNATEILNWNTGTTDYNGYTLWYECEERVINWSETSLHLNFSNNDTNHCAIVWNAAGNNVNLSDGYTHSYCEEIGVSQYFDNTLSLNVSDGCQSTWTLTKDGNTIANGTVNGNGTAQQIYTWNTETTDLEGATLTVTTEEKPNYTHYFYVQVDHPEYFSSISGSLDNKFSDTNTGTSLSFNTAGALNHPLHNVDLTGKFNYYFKFVPSNNDVIYTVKVYAEGSSTPSNTLVNGQTGTQTNKVVMPSVLNQKTVVITSSLPEAKKYITVNITGDASKIDMRFGTTAVTGLHTGSQTLEIPEGKRITLMHTTPTNIFAEVRFGSDANNLNVIKEHTGEGNYNSYTIQPEQLADGCVLEIDTNFSDNIYNVNITVPTGLEGYIKSVTINNVDKTTDWRNGVQLQAQDGQFVSIVGDDWNYLTTAITTNNIPEQNVSHSWGRRIRQNTTIAFDVTSIDRPNSFTFTKGTNTNTASMKTTLGSYKTLSSGTEYFCDDDNPIKFSASTEQKEGSGENQKPYQGVWYVTNPSLGFAKTVIATKTNDITYTVQPGDVIEVKYVTESNVPKTLKVNYEFNGTKDFSVVPTMKKNGITMVTDHAVVTDDVVTVQSIAGVFEVTGVSVKGTAIEPVDGIYSITIANDMAETVDISEDETEDVVTISITGTPYMSIALEGDYWADAEQTIPNVNVTYNNETVTLTSSAATPVAYVTGATITIEDNPAVIENYISSVKINDISKNAVNGVYTLTPSKANTTVEISISPKQTFRLYGAGINTIHTCTLNTNQTVTNGWQDIYFCEKDQPFTFQLDGINDDVTVYFTRKSDETIETLQPNVGNIYTVQVEQGDELRLLIVTPDLNGSGKATIKDLTEAIQSLLPVVEGQAMPLCTEDDLETIKQGILNQE